MDSYLCPQVPDAYWKITARVNRTQPPNIFLGGYVLAVYDRDGKFVKASEPSAEDEYATMTLNGNCQVNNRYRSNLEIDVTEFHNMLPLTVRLVRSKQDLRPIAPDFKADFPQAGNYYIQYNVTQ